MLAAPELAPPASGDGYPRYDQDSGQANPVHSEDGLGALRRERKEDDQEDEGGGEDGHGCALAQAAGTLTPPRGEGCRRLGVSSGPDVIAAPTVSELAGVAFTRTPSRLRQGGEQSR